MFVFTTDIKDVIKTIIIVILTIICIVFLWTYSYIVYNVNGNQANVSIFYLLPMKNVDAKKHVVLDSELGHAKVKIESEWKNQFTLQLKLEEISLPSGQKIQIKIEKLPTLLGIIKKTASVEMRFKAVPKVLELKPIEHVNTRGNVKIIFNTLLDPDSLHQHVRASVKGQLVPGKIKIGENEVVDTSQWTFQSEKPLEYQQTYSLIFRKGLKSLNGEVLLEDIEKKFTTTIQPKIVEMDPKQGQNNVPMYTKLKIRWNQNIKQGRVSINGINGTTIIEKDTLYFLPQRVLLPNTTYKGIVKAVTVHDEPSKDFEFTFSTQPIESAKLWIEVILKAKQNELIIHQGNKVLKIYKIGADAAKFPDGTYSIQRFGRFLYTPEYIEYPSQWIDLGNQYYIQNAAPKYNTTVDTLKNSNCLFIRNEDLLWIKEHFKGGEMVIIHKG